MSDFVTAPPSANQLGYTTQNRLAIATPMPLAELDQLELLIGRSGQQSVEVVLRPFRETWRKQPRHGTRLLDVLAKRKEAKLAEEILWCMWKWRLGLKLRSLG